MNHKPLTEAALLGNIQVDLFAGTSVQQKRWGDKTLMVLSPEFQSQAKLTHLPETAAGIL